MTLSRTLTRASALLAALLTGVLALSACASSDDDTDSPTDDTASSEEGYPITIDTGYGEITLDDKPERIVVLTPQYVDILTAIGEQPIVTHPGFANEDDFFENYVWLDGQYTGEFDAELLTAEIQGIPEVIASYEPDLILGNVWNVPEELYSQMSDIAPTYTGRVPDAMTDWTELITDLGEMTGKEGEAAAAVAAYESEIVEARNRLPGFEGRTFFAGHYLDQEYALGSGGVYPDLGMEPAEGQPLDHTTSAPSISLENIDQLTADVLVMAIHVDPTGRDELEADPRFTNLPAFQNGTVIWQDWQLARAVSEPGPASSSWYLEEIVSQLEQSPLNQE